jgi:hypothetical protein
MLPNNGGLKEILFPMKAKIYYAQTFQNDYGNVAKQWIFDRTVSCSMITDMSGKSFSGELTTKGTDFIYNSHAYFRTSEDIRKSSSGKYFPITSISISEIVDPSGQMVWINGQNLKLSSGAVSTKYEVKTIVPTFDYDHNLRHWRIFLSKSQVQGWGE